MDLNKSNLENKEVKEKCDYCGNEEGPFNNNDVDKPLCNNCFVSADRVSEVTQELCNLLGIRSCDTFEYNKYLYKIKLALFSVGNGIAIPVIMRLNNYHSDLFRRESWTDDNINDLFTNLIDNREFFEMMLYKQKIKVIPPSEIINEMVKRRIELSN